MTALAMYGFDMLALPEPANMPFMLGLGMYGLRKEGVGTMEEWDEADATSDADATRRGWMALPGDRGMRATIICQFVLMIG